MASIPDFDETINTFNGSFNSQDSDNHSEVSKTESSEFRLVYMDDSTRVSQDSSAEEEKLYKQMNAEVNIVYTSYKISEFILNTYKELAYSNSHALQKAAKFVSDTILSCRLENSIKLKSRSGEMVDLLGLDDSNHEVKNGVNLLIQCQLKDNVLEILKEKIKATMLRKQHMKEIFADHYPKETYFEDEFPCKDMMMKFSHMYNMLEDKIHDLKSVLNLLELLMEELLKIQQLSEIKEQELKKNSLIFTKVKYMKYVASILEEKANIMLNKNKNRIKHLNTKGKEHEQNVSRLREKINNLKSNINLYKRKESLSSNFAQLVKEYNKTKMDLKSKQQTLCILNEADTAGFSNQMDP